MAPVGVLADRKSIPMERTHMFSTYLGRETAPAVGPAFQAAE
jgi:hypothetical protein